MAVQNETRRVEIIANGQKVDASLNQMRAAARLLNDELSKLPKNSKEFADTAEKYKHLQSQIQQTTGQVRGLHTESNKFWTNVKTVAVGALAGNLFTGALNGLKSMVGGMISSRKQIADELADIEKTTGLSRMAVQQLDKDLGTINTRTSRSELRKLAEEAGKLGHSSAEDVRKFVEEMNTIKVALGEDLGEDAIIQIGKMTKVYDAGALNIASSINAIGAASEASEQYLVDFASRLGGASRTAKISAPDIIGYGAVLDMMGLQVEMSGTALSNFVIDFVKDTGKFEKAAGMQKGALQKLIGEKGTNEGLLAFIENLKASSKGQGDFLQKLEQVGIDGSRGAAVFLTLSNNLGEVKKQQALANTEFTKATSITDEYNKKNNNFAANMEKLGKTLYGWFTNNFITRGLEALLNALVDTTTEADKLISAFKDQEATVNSLQKNITPLLNRYDELKGKTTLNKDEQTELKDIINKVGEAIPSAITSFDKYGQALDINSGKAREFIQNQALALRSMNRDAITALKEQIKDREQLIKEENDRLKRLKSDPRSIPGFQFLEPDELERRMDAQFAGAYRISKKKLDEWKRLQDEDTARMRQLEGTDILEALNARTPGKAAGVVTGTGDDGKDKSGKKTKTPNELLAEQMEKRRNLENADYKEREEMLKQWHDHQVTVINNAYVNDEINKDTSTSRKEALDFKYLEYQRNLLIEYGKDTTEIDKQISQFKVDSRAKAEETITKKAKEELKNRMTDEEFSAKWMKKQKDKNLEEQLAALDAALAYELSQVQYTEEQKKKLTEYFEKEKDRVRKEYLAKQIQDNLQVAQAVMNIWQSVSGIIDNMKTEELNRERHVSEEKVAMLTKQLNDGIISQEEYNKQVGIVNEAYRQKEAEYKREKFRREQISSAIQAGINTAVSVTALLANPVLAILAGVAGAAQIAYILSQPVPEYFLGGPINVTGESGRSYKASYGKPNKRGLVATPTLLAGERGEELVIPNYMYRHPRMMNVWNATEAAISKKEIPNFTSSNTGGDMSALIPYLVSIDSKLDKLNVVFGQRDYNEFLDVQQRGAEFLKM